MEGIRKCDVCGSPMTEGFCIHDGEQYFCSEECLHTAYAQEEYDKMYEDDEAYWTRWEEEEDTPPATLRVCFKAPGKNVEVREINNTLSALQGLVGGFIEIAGTPINGVVILANEEGLIEGLPVNCYGLVGPLVFVGTSATDFRSLTDEEVTKILEREELHAQRPQNEVTELPF